MENPGTGSVPLDKGWRFHLGDEKAWADPALDDSGWEPIRIDQPWGQQSHPSYTGFAWYRQRIEIDNSNPAGTKNLALLIPPAQDAYEIYWNGQKLGTYGSLPPHASGGHLAMTALSPSRYERSVGAAGVEGAAFVGRSSGGGRLAEAPLLGDASVLAARAKSIGYANDERRLPNTLIGAVNLVIGVLSFLLYLRDRKQGLYLWLALYLVASGL